LRTEATGAEQTADVIWMVDDVEVLANQVDDAPAGPQAGAVSGSLGAGDNQPRQALPLRRRELRRATGCGTRAQAGAPVPPVRLLPSAHRSPIDADTIGDDMHGEVTLEQLESMQPSTLELRRASLWAHAAPPTGQYSAARTLLMQQSLIP
jgi:hypothetical protein